MRAGDLDRRITIWRMGEEQQDPGGGWIPAQPELVATVWAAVQQTGGREFLDAAQVTAERRVVFRIRYRSDIQQDWWIEYGGWKHDVHEIRELGRREGLELHCTATEEAS